ncbi:MAG: hypothetical protein Q8O43_04510 [Dehalococcoidia bacterium]|nr:hypothetical protein [Dehalococcoidia bacterium]
MTFITGSPIIALNMGFLKGLAIGLLSFILFILLTVFGIAFTVNQIALNPNFITGVINEIDFSDLAQEMLKQQSQDEGPPPELVNAVISALDKIEPVLKEKINLAIKDAYAYLLGKSNAPDFKKTLGDTFMNPPFIESVLNSIDLSQIINQLMQEQSPGGEGDALTKSLFATVDKLEPTIKKQVVTASGPVFNYLLGKTQTIDLKTTMRQTVLNRDFVTALIDALDIKTLARDMLTDQLDIQLPAGVGLARTEIDQIITALEPAFKQGLVSAADPMADWLLGIRPSFSVNISLSPAMPQVKTIIRQAFMRQLPPELVSAPQALVDQAFETFWASAAGSIPASFSIDSSMFGTGIPQTITKALGSMQDSLRDMRGNINEVDVAFRDARSRANTMSITQLGENGQQTLVEQLAMLITVIKFFRMVYWGLIIGMLVIIGLIVLIHRSVRGTSRDLGITFLSYGAIEFAGVFIIRSIITRPEFLQGMMTGGETPASLQQLVSSIMLKLTQPLFTFTLACAIIGIVLLVVSFVYPKKQKMVETVQPPATTP